MVGRRRGGGGGGGGRLMFGECRSNFIKMTSGWTLLYLWLEALYGAVYTKIYIEEDNVRIKEPLASQ